MWEIDQDRVTRSDLRFTEKELLTTLKARILEYGVDNGEDVIEGICEEYMLNGPEREFLLDMLFDGKL